MSVMLDQYAERLSRKRKSPYSIRNFASVSRRYTQWLAAQGLTPETATYEVIEEYIDGLDLAASSKAEHLKWLQAAYNYAIRRGTIRHNPALDIEVELGESAEPRIIPNQVLREILANTWKPNDVLFAHLLIYTGMRRSEIRELQWGTDENENEAVSAVWPERETIRVFGKRDRKGRKRRLVPLHPALGEALMSAKRDTPYVISSTGKNGAELMTLHAMSRRLHPTFTPHDYRRTVATSLRRNGVDSSVRDRIMGWAPRTVFERHYDNVADVELKRAILKLYADDPV